MNARESERRGGLGHLSSLAPSSSDSYYAQIHIDLIDGNPDNYRRIYPRIRELADSISRVGLLQNIVVVEDGERFTVRAGERRYRAVKMLIDDGRRERQEVMCLVIKHEFASLANLAENTARVNVPVWHEGRRYLEQLDAGIFQRDLAEAVGKSQAHISYAKTIAEGVHPDLVEKLDRIDGSLLTSRILRQLVRMQDEDGDPDYSRQIEFLQNVVTVKKRKSAKKVPRKGRGSAAAIAARLDILRAFPAPEQHRPVVRAIVRFLDGEEQELSL